MPEFVRRDADATCDPRHLAQLLNVDAVDIDKERVIVHGEPPANVQNIIDAYIYDPHWNAPQEEVGIRDAIRNQLQTLDDATRTAATWNGLTAAQRQETTRLAIQGFVRLVRFIARRFL